MLHHIKHPSLLQTHLCLIDVGIILRHQNECIQNQKNITEASKHYEEVEYKIRVFFLYVECCLKFNQLEIEFKKHEIEIK